MNTAGNGDGNDGAERDEIDGFHPVQRRGGSVFGPTPLNPDQGCVGCLISAAVILVTFLIWAGIYWYNESDFHPPGIDESVPTVQEKLHQKTSGNQHTPIPSAKPIPAPSVQK